MSVVRDDQGEFPPQQVAGERAKSAIRISLFHRELGARCDDRIAAYGAERTHPLIR